MKILKKRNARSAFSLIELMVAMGILTILMLMLTALLDQIQRSWRFSESRISQFREARVAFDLMAKNIGQASLNTYWDMVVNDEGEIERYAPTSELHFITMNDVSGPLPATSTQRPFGHAVFFQAPLGFSTEYRNLNSLFNARGYFVSFGSDKNFKPSFVDSPDRYRFRLMEFRPPAEANQVFQDGKDEREQGVAQEFDQWYKQALSVGDGNFESHLNPLAENILMIVISPRDSLEDAGASRNENFSTIAPNYAYNSNDPNRVLDPDDEFSSFTQQVPPLIRLTMVAIDETAAVQNENGSSMPQELVGPIGGLFKQTQEFARDIEVLSQHLNERKVNHKVFSTLVLLRSAKWTGR
jgi:uncharacterized protein (TIGR02599 family)